MSTQQQLLSQLVTVGYSDGLEPRSPFPATVVLANGQRQPAIVTALLLRTVVWFSSDPAAKQVARLDHVLVDKERLVWKQSDGRRGSDNGAPDSSGHARARGRVLAQRNRIAARDSNDPRIAQAAENAELRLTGRKRCGRCKTIKVLGEFSSNGWCVECARNYARDQKRAYNARNPLRFCQSCRQHKPRAGFRFKAMKCDDCAAAGAFKQCFRCGQRRPIHEFPMVNVRHTRYCSGCRGQGSADVAA